MKAEREMEIARVTADLISIGFDEEVAVALAKSRWKCREVENQLKGKTLADIRRALIDALCAASITDAFEGHQEEIVDLQGRLGDSMMQRRYGR
jgi:hypothetical protein